MTQRSIKSGDDVRHQERLVELPHAVIAEAYGRPHIIADLVDLETHVACHVAHVVTLVEDGVIHVDTGRLLLVELDRLASAGPAGIIVRPELNDLYTCMEVQITEALGEDVAGHLHTGRSRNDLFVGIQRLVIRDALLAFVETLERLLSSLLERAELEVETVIPGYTHHSQQAQPTTLAHFLLAHFDALMRDADRMMTAYRRVNLSPLGAAAFAGSTFTIRRERIAELLGFAGLVENTMDASGGRDFQLEVGANLAVHSSNIGRLAESLILYTSSEFGLIELDDAFASVSSIMPQKKNPVSLEMIEAFGSRSIGHFMTMLSLLKSTTLGQSREVGYVDSELASMFRDNAVACEILAGVLRTLRVNAERALDLIGDGYALSTNLAEELTRRSGIPFRTAHRIVGRAVADAIRHRFNLSTRLLEEAAAAIGAPRLRLSPDELDALLQPAQAIDACKTVGGPQPSEASRMILERRKRLSGIGRWVMEGRTAIAAAESQRRSAARALMARGA